MYTARPVLTALRAVEGSLLLTAALFLSACDTALDVIDLDEIDVATESYARLPVLPDSTTLVTGTVTADEDPPRGFEVTRIELRDEFIDYLPLQSAPRRSCALDLLVLVDQILAGRSTVQIRDGAVTSIDNRYADAYDRDTVCTQLGLAACPVRQAQFTQRQLRDRVNAAVERGTFTLDFALINPDACEGTLFIEKVRFKYDVF